MFFFKMYLCRVLRFLGFNSYYFLEGSMTSLKGNYKIEKGEVLTGSGLLKCKKIAKPDRVRYMLQHMHENAVFKDAGSQCDETSRDQLLGKCVENYGEYRKDWKEQPQTCIRDTILGPEMLQRGITPLCIDIETAAICDLACPFCFREYYATPDKLIDSDFCFKLLDQAAELGVPSLKFNWRGEPLLHPKLPDFIAYAKRNGILETIINTNATMLDKNKARDLISAGLDFIIYSFDGGTKETYEKMRLGRFKKNSFEQVYDNIRQFSSIRQEMGSALPYTKIQMIMTQETFDEKEQFFSLFSDCVDDVSVSQYTERGGELKDIDKDTRKIYEQALVEHGLPSGTPYMKDPHGQLLISKVRKPCEQPFQRLLVTYEGRVGMCCYDWGATHPVGYVHEMAYNNKNEYEKIIEKAKKREKGFELLSNLEMPKTYNSPAEKVQTLADIWYGAEIDKVRIKHISKNVDDVEICKNCTFKDTYEWIDVGSGNNKENPNAGLNLPEGLV